MAMGLEDRAPDPDAILILIKDALWSCRASSSRLYGFARGLEIGISTLHSTGSSASDSVQSLEDRSLRLSASRDDYDRGVALGINLASDLASILLAQVQVAV